MNIKLAENIKVFRTERGMTQKAFADALSVSPQAVSRWENGQAYPDIEMLPRIAEIFKVSLDTLIGTGMSFLQRKHKELQEAQARVKGEQDYAGRRRVCEILEELAAEGASQILFLKEALSLYQVRGIGVDTVERAREYCRKLLMKSSGDDRVRHLTTILFHEDSENVDRWREFVSNNSFSSCWDDVLLMRYTYGNLQPELFEPTRQRVVHEALWKLVQTLILGRIDRNSIVGSFQALNPSDTHRLALNILDLFSAQAGDIYLDLRVYVEIRMAAALFAEGRDEEGFSTLETILAHIQEFENLHNTMRRGSVCVLSEIERPTSGIDIRNCLADIGSQMRRHEFDRVRRDVRFVALYHRVEGMDEEDLHAMMNLFDFSRSKTLGKNDLLLAVRTADGISREAKIHNIYKRGENGAHPDEQEFIDNLREAGNTEIRYIVCMFQGGIIDIPSYFFRQKLLELNPANGKAKMLLNGAFRYHVKTINDAAPPKKQPMEAREMNESYIKLAHAVVRKILPQTGIDYSTFRYQYENAEVAETRMYRRGFDVRFRMKEDSPAVTAEGQRTYGTVSAQIPGLLNGMGFILWVKDGMIQRLEGYSYEEDLPDTVEKYTLHDTERLKTHICRAEFLVTGDFDPEWLTQTLKIEGTRCCKKGEINPITQKPNAFSAIMLGWAEESGMDIDVNNVIRKALRSLLPLADKLAELRNQRDMHYSLSLKCRVERTFPESAPDLSLAPDIIAFLNVTQSRHELSIIP